MTKRGALIVLDAAMLLSFSVLMSWRFSGVAAHEWIGLALIALILTHLVVHWGWVESSVARIMVKRDDSTSLRWDFATKGAVAMAHVPQMYSLYELYFDAAFARAAALKRSAGDTVQLRQFYIDREFDRFPLHHGVVLVRRRPPLGAGAAAVRCDLRRQRDGLDAPQ